MGLIRAPLDPWNAMSPILLLAVGAGHSVQILKRYYEEYARLKKQKPQWSLSEINREAVVEATTKVGAVMLTAGTIASLSFASLSTLGTPSIKTFGICVSFGILAALVVEMTFIPSLRVLMKPPSEKQVERESREEFFDPLLRGLANLIRRKKERWIAAVSLALALGSLFGLFRLETGNNFSQQFFEANAFMRLFEKHGFMEGFQALKEKTGAGATIEVLVDTGEKDGVKNPDTIRRMDQLAKYISAQKADVKKVISIVDLLKILKRAFEKRDISSQALPTSREEIAQYLLFYEMGGNTADIDRLIDADRRQAIIFATATSDDLPVCKRIMDRINRKGEKIFAGSRARAMVGGQMANLVAVDETIVEGKIKNLIQIALITTLLTSLVLKSAIGGLLVLLPLACAALINLGLMGWTGILLSMGTAAISAMAVGIGADYAIYFIFRVREELKTTADLREAIAKTLMTSGKAIAYVATAVAGGYLCLTLSLFKVHVLLGVLVALTMVTTCLGTVAFLSSVLVLIKPRFLSVNKR
ncbi:MAG: MMPL family transporter, partial [Deltaproteobacteria bacterium]|nr:MMPL family transporter [Deltaproteobacteria bacterium]